MSEAHGTGSNLQVWRGTKRSTVGGLLKKDLMKNPKSGKIVSKKKFAQGKKLYAMLKRTGRLAKPFTAESARRLRSRRR